MNTIKNWFSAFKHVSLLAIAGVLFSISLMTLFSLQFDNADGLSIALMTSGFLFAIVTCRLDLRTNNRSLFQHSWKWCTLGVILFVTGIVAGLLFQTTLSMAVLIGMRLLGAVVASLGITLVFYTLRNASEGWKNGSIVIVSALFWVLYTVLKYRFPNGSSWHDFFVSIRIVYMILAASFVLCVFIAHMEQKRCKKSEVTDKQMKA